MCTLVDTNMILRNLECTLLYIQDQIPLHHFTKIRGFPTIKQGIGWVWVIISWVSRLQENHRYFEESMEYTSRINKVNPERSQNVTA